MNSPVLMRPESPDTTSPLNLSIKEETRIKTEDGIRSSQSTPSPPPSLPSWTKGRVWSPAVDPARRIWSPAVTCEQESKLINNNNVVVDVMCGDCGGMSSKFRPDSSGLCSSCIQGQSRTERAFPVRTFFKIKYIIIFLSMSINCKKKSELVTSVLYLYNGHCTTLE